MRWSDFRERGGWWVVAQFVLMAGVAIAAFASPRMPRLLLPVGVAVALGGAVFLAAGVRALGPALTPFPKPPASAALRTDGPFAVVRHPIYGGGIGVFAGIGLATSLPALLVALALAILWALKARREERLLLERFAGYAAYRRRVRRRLIPFVY